MKNKFKILFMLVVLSSILLTFCFAPTISAETGNFVRAEKGLDVYLYSDQNTSDILFKIPSTYFIKLENASSKQYSYYGFTGFIKTSELGENHASYKDIPDQNNYFKDYSTISKIFTQDAIDNDEAVTLFSKANTTSDKVSSFIKTQITKIRFLGDKSDFHAFAMTPSNDEKQSFVDKGFMKNPASDEEFLVYIRKTDSKINSILIRENVYSSGSTSGATNPQRPVTPENRVAKTVLTVAIILLAIAMIFLIFKPTSKKRKDIYLEN